MRRAIGIVRVSQVAGREGESFASPDIQADRIRTECDREGLTLLRIMEELDVSGGADLKDRPGLGPAVEAIEAGEAEVIAAAYFDRFFRSMKVQQQVLERVETAGGRVLTVDLGFIGVATAAQWLSSTQMGMMSEYYRRLTAERLREVQIRAVARGAVPFSSMPPGLRRLANGTVAPDELAPVMVEAFGKYADGATIQEIRDHLAAHGVQRSHNGVYRLLSNRLYLGEIHFGDLTNLHAYDNPVISQALWRRVQAVRRPRGGGARSDRLLARLDVLRCASCGGLMTASVQTQRGRAYPYYRCGKVRADCAARAAISAVLIEQLVTDSVRRALEGMEGHASADQDARKADAALERAQAELDAAIRAFAALQDEPVALERLAELRQCRDEAREHAGRLRGLRSALVVSASADWESLSIEARRGLIRAVVARVLVAPGRGTGRVAVEFRVE
jgi:DNA invertase Pin-like site-specific DNA recombinase